MSKAAKSKPIAEYLTPSFIMKLAGQKYYERGESYYKQGLVGSVDVYGDLIGATVYGTETYEIQFRLEGGEFEHECSCPLGESGEFCKHCVAVALTVIDRLESEKGKPKKANISREQTELTLEDVKTYLLAKDKDFLVELLMNQVMLDQALRAKLFLNAAHHQLPPEERLKSLYQWIDQAVRLGPKQFLYYDQVPFYSQKVEAIVPHLEDLLSQGYAEEVALLAEYAQAAIAQALDRIESADVRLDNTIVALEKLEEQAKRQTKAKEPPKK